MGKNKKEASPRYIRKQGNKSAVGDKKRNLTFSFSKHVPDQGQSIETWAKLGLLEKLIIRIKNLGQHTALTVRQNKWIKEYHKVSFPPESGFKEPKHISGVTWAVMHLTDSSKEVVVGYIEDEVFYIVFFDKDHIFWPSNLKNT